MDLAAPDGYLEPEVRSTVPMLTLLRADGDDPRLLGDLRHAPSDLEADGFDGPASGSAD